MKMQLGMRILITIGLCFGFWNTGWSQPEPINHKWDVFVNPWLSDREMAMPNTPVLVKSLNDAAEYVLRWKLPPDAETWRKRRPEVERAFRKAIGLENLPERTPLNARITGQSERAEYTIENVLFESRPNFPVTANLYRPKSIEKEKRAAVLCSIGHYLSAGKTAVDVQSRCIELARMGFVVLAYDAVGQGERMLPGNIHHDAGYALLPLGETIAGWMVWDSMRAIDYLLTLEEVDPNRIGVTGNSGGGLNTLFTAALDPRVRAACIVGFTFEFNNWLKYGGAHCTCTHLPGLFQNMEWFEIAGLIAPRAVMMLHGEYDHIFPIGGARRAGRNMEALYHLLGLADLARFVELPKLPHAYTRPYRERMYGWMAQQLLEQGNGEPISEVMTEIPIEKDPQLLCNPDGSLIRNSSTVVDIARKRALDTLAGLPREYSSARGEAVRRWIHELTAPPEAQPHYLMPQTIRRTTETDNDLEYTAFLSEEGASIPGLLWLPKPQPSPMKTCIIVDDRGKSAVVESGLVNSLLKAGFAVLSIDLRGRGETLGHYGPNYDTNFRLIANQTLFGQPLAGRRAYDLIRAVDYLSRRKELNSDKVAVVGIGNDALPVLLAAAVDERIGHVALAGYFHSFVSQMRSRQPDAQHEMSSAWNDPQLNGRINVGDYEVDFGSVIPSALATADIPDIAALIFPRKILFCQVRDLQAPNVEDLKFRFRTFINSAGTNWLEYAPERPLDSRILLDWLGRTSNP